MTWSAPMTAVAGATFTAAQFNQYVRDNLNQTAPALATLASQYFVATGANALAARKAVTATVATSQTTTSLTYANLTTPGPAVTVDTGVLALVIISCNMTNNNTNSATFMSFDISGATSTAAATANSIIRDGMNANNSFRASGVKLMTLTPGSNTFTAKYAVGAGSTGTYVDRDITVIPF